MFLKKRILHAKYSIFLHKGSVLIVLDKMDNNMITASRNIPQVSTMQAKDLSALDLLQFKYIVMPKQAVKVIENTFVKKAND